MPYFTALPCWDRQEQKWVSELHCFDRVMEMVPDGAIRRLTRMLCRTYLSLN